MSIVSNGSKILIWKQITTSTSRHSCNNHCFQWFKDTNLKANHNSYEYCSEWQYIVSNGSKILIWKQITTRCWLRPCVGNCFQWFKDTNLKANHNVDEDGSKYGVIVSNGSKILIWKQITTSSWRTRYQDNCFQWFKDTNLKANHNELDFFVFAIEIVSNGSKILIWKQITTKILRPSNQLRLFPMVQRY